MAGIQNNGIRLGVPEPPREFKPFGRQTNTDERLRFIVEAAARQFEERGFHGTSVQDIADAVGLTKAALYHYITCKEDLLSLVHDAFVSTMLESAERFLTEHDDPVEQLLFFVESILVTVNDYRPYVRAFFQDLGVLRGERYEWLREKRSKYEKLVENCVTAGIKKGVFSADIDPHLTTLYIFGACNWSYQWLHPDGPMPIEAIVATWQRFTMQAVGARMPRGAKRAR